MPWTERRTPLPGHKVTQPMPGHERQWRPPEANETSQPTYKYIQDIVEKRCRENQTPFVLRIGQRCCPGENGGTLDVAGYVQGVPRDLCGRCKRGSSPCCTRGGS